jgi:hypothetical protein
LSQKEKPFGQQALPDTVFGGKIDLRLWLTGVIIISAALDRVFRQFAGLTPDEKAHFLNTVVSCDAGKWITLDGEISFVRCDESWTEKDEKGQE